jgi:hypothetical protein
MRISFAFQKFIKMEEAKSSRRTREEIIVMMEEFTSSGAMTVKEFCEMQEITRATFYNWQKIYRGDLPQKQGQSAFVSLRVTPQGEQGTHPVLFAEVKGIRIYREVSAGYLKELAQ